MPRDNTKAFLCGHICWLAYHSPRLLKLNTAICTSPYLIVAPPSGGKSLSPPTLTQARSALAPASFASRSSASICRSDTVSPGQSAGRRWPRSEMISIVGSVSSVFTNCRNSRRLAGSLTASAHSQRYESTRNCILASSSSQRPRLSSMMTLRNCSTPPAIFSIHTAVRVSLSAVMM